MTGEEEEEVDEGEVKEEDGRGEVAAAGDEEVTICQSLFPSLLLFASPIFLLPSTSLRFLLHGCNTELTTGIF